VPRRLRFARCALTAPFHPPPRACAQRRADFLWHSPSTSLPACRPRVSGNQVPGYAASCPVVFGLSSLDTSQRPRAVLNIANESSGRFALLLPDNRFHRLPDQCFKTRRRLFSRSGPDARNGLSLPRNGCFFRSFHSGIDVPDLPLRFQLAASAARSAFLLRYPLPVSPGRGGLVASGPLQFPRLVRRPRLQPPLPIGTVTSLRIKAFSWNNNLSAHLPNPPDLPSLPTAGFYL